jgi:hypothetical protein
MTGKVLEHNDRKVAMQLIMIICITLFMTVQIVMIKMLILVMVTNLNMIVEYIAQCT